MDGTILSLIERLTHHSTLDAEKLVVAGRLAAKVEKLGGIDTLRGGDPDYDGRLRHEVTMLRIDNKSLRAHVARLEARLARTGTEVATEARTAAADRHAAEIASTLRAEIDGPRPINELVFLANSMGLRTRRNGLWSYTTLRRTLDRAGAGELMSKGV